MAGGNQRRACVFCQSTENKINKQHVWPKWMREVIEGADSGEMAERARIHQKPDGTVVSHLRWLEAPIDWEVSGACERCNSGWIEALESELQPVISPMIQHEEIPRGPVEQDVLARWATLVVLMAQHGHPKEMPHTILAERYHRFYEAKELPNCQIWICRRNGEGPWPTDYLSKELLISLAGLPEATAPNANVTAFAVGHVAFVYWGSQFKQGPVISLGENLMPYLLPIWPDISPVRWPPQGLLGPTGLEAVIEDLAAPLRG